MRFCYLLLLLIFCSCNAATYYVVRHAEKEKVDATMSSDVPLSKAGQERALALQQKLQRKNILAIFSTNTLRTKATARPLSEQLKLPILTYDAKDTGFVHQLKDLPRGHYLVVGHSNTVDNLVNALLQKQVLTDLEDSAYGDLFIVKRKGKNMLFEKDHFGK